MGKAVVVAVEYEIDPALGPPSDRFRPVPSDLHESQRRPQGHESLGGAAIHRDYNKLDSEGRRPGRNGTSRRASRVQLAPQLVVEKDQRPPSIECQSAT